MIKPVTLASLADRCCWVAWQTQLRRPGDKKAAKLPYDPKGPDGRMAKADDPTTWGTRSQAEARAEQLPKPFGAGGIGIELVALGDGRSIGGIDLDTCRDPKTDEIEPWAWKIVEQFASYTEVSPSGTGVKIFFTYPTEAADTIRTALGASSGGKPKHSRLWSCRTGDDHPPSIELHVSNRYFTTTGLILDGSTEELRALRTAELMTLIEVDGPAFAADLKPLGDERDCSAAQLNGKALSRRRISDRSRSAAAFRIGAMARGNGADFDGMCEAIREDPATAEWYTEKGTASGGRELRRIWQKTAPEPHWLQDAQRDREGDPRPNLANAMAALRAAPGLRDLVAHDEMLRAPLLMRPVPTDKAMATEPFVPRPLRDTDVAAVQEFLQLAGIAKIGKDAMHQALGLRAVERSFHPVRNYLNNSSMGWYPTIGEMVAFVP